MLDGDAEGRIAANRLMIELGDLFGAEQRKVLLKLRVPGMAALGLAKIATLELAYVELPGVVEHVVSLPITVASRGVTAGTEVTQGRSTSIPNSAALRYTGASSGARSSASGTDEHVLLGTFSNLPRYLRRVV